MTKTIRILFITFVCLLSFHEANALHRYCFYVIAEDVGAKVADESNVLLIVTHPSEGSEQNAPFFKRYEFSKPYHSKSLTKNKIHFKYRQVQLGEKSYAICKIGPRGDIEIFVYAKEELELKIYSKGDIKLSKFPNKDLHVDHAREYVKISPCERIVDGKKPSRKDMCHFRLNQDQCLDIVELPHQEDIEYRRTFTWGHVSFAQDISFSENDKVDIGVLCNRNKLTLHKKTFFNVNWALFNYGTIDTQGDLDLKLSRFFNAKATLNVGGKLSLNAEILDNREGVIESTEGIKISRSEEDIISTIPCEIGNESGEILSPKSIEINATKLVNKKGKIQSDENIKLDTKELLDNSEEGEILAAGSLELETCDLSNKKGKIQSDGDIKFSVSKLLDNSEEGEIYAKGTLELGAHNFLNDKGKIHVGKNVFVTASESVSNEEGELLADKSLTVKTPALKNKNGLLQGAKGTKVSVGRIYENEGGAIGAKGDTFLTFKESFEHEIDDLGKVQGDRIFVKFKGQKAIVKKGALKGHQEIQLASRESAHLSEVHFITPLLVTQVVTLALGPQAACGHIMALMIEGKFCLAAEVRTNGLFEIREMRETDAHKADAVLDTLNGTTQLSSLEINHPIDAKEGVNVFAPNASLTTNQDINVGDAHIDFRTAQFWQRQGALMGKRGRIRAPFLLRTGDLIHDPSLAGIASWQTQVPKTRTEMRKEKVHGVKKFWKGHSKQVPHEVNYTVATDHSENFNCVQPTDAVISVDDLHLEGFWCHTGYLEAHNLYYKHNNSPLPGFAQDPVAKFVGGTAHIEQDLTFGSSFQLNLSQQHASAYVNTNRSELFVRNRVHSDFPVKVMNEGCRFDYGLLDTNVNLTEVTVTVPHPQKLISAGQAASSVEAIQHFGPQSSTTSTRVVRPEDKGLEGYVAAPRVVVYADGRTKQIGSAHNQQNKKKSPVYLGEDFKMFAGLTVCAIDSVAGFLAKTAFKMDLHQDKQLVPLLIDPYGATFHFLTRHKREHNPELSEKFYRHIAEDVIVVNRDLSIERISGDVPFLYAPEILKRWVEAAARAKLNRPNIDLHKWVNLQQIQELHRNATDHLRQHNEGVFSLNLLEKPVLYYVKEACVSQKGNVVVALAPRLVLPQWMMDQANTSHGDNLVTHDLFVLNSNHNPLPAIQGTPLDSEFEKLLAAGDVVVSDPSQALVPYNQQNMGGIIFNGNVTADNVFVAIHGPIQVKNTIRAGNILLRSLLSDVTLESSTVRVDDGKNFHDIFDKRARVLANKILVIMAGHNVGFMAAETFSQLMTYVEALNDIYDIPMELLRKRVNAFYNKKSHGTEEKVDLQHQGSSHSSAGAFVEKAGNDVVLAATNIHAPEKNFIGQRLLAPEVHDITATDFELHSKKKELHDHHEVKTSRGITLGGGKTTIEMAESIKLTNPTLADVMTVLKAQRVELKAGENMDQGTRRRLYQGTLWDKDKTEEFENHQMLPLHIPNTVIIEAEEAVVENADNPQNIQGGAVQHHDVEKQGHYHVKEKKRLSQRAKTAIHGIIAAAMIAINPGQALATATHVAGSAGAGVTAAGTAVSTCLTSSMVVNMVDEGMKGLRKSFHADELKKLGKTALISGLTAGLASHFQDLAGLSGEQVKFYEKAQKALIKSTVAAAVQTALEGGKLGQNVLDCLKQGAVDFAAAEAAGGIGDWKNGQKIDFFTHKLLHGILGGTLAEFSGSDFASGAMGAVVAETVAELVQDIVKPKADDMDNSVLEDAFDELTEFNQATDKKLDLGEAISLSKHRATGSDYDKYVGLAGKIAGIGSVFAAGGDVEGAALAANNAIDNNFLHVAWIAVSVGSAAWTAYDVYEAYVKAGGGEAGAIAALKVLGINVAMTVAGGAVVKIAGEAVKPVGEFFKDYIGKSPLLSHAVARAEHAVATGVAKVEAGLEHVSMKVGDTAIGKAGQAVLKKADEVAEKVIAKAESASASATASLGMTEFARDVKFYIKDMQRRSGLKIPQNQRELLADATREKMFVKLEGSVKTQHTEQFTRAKRESLIAEWEKNTGQTWPKYPNDMKKVDGSLHPFAGQNHQAHHIIPQENGGPHAWWNMHPLTFGANHQGGVHGAGSVLRKLQNEVK